VTTVKVIRFNWPKYAGVLAIVLAAAASTVLGAPLPVRAALWLAGLPARGRVDRILAGRDVLGL
jgi:hypothetical protein